MNLPITRFHTWNSGIVEQERRPNRLVESIRALKFTYG